MAGRDLGTPAEGASIKLPSAGLDGAAGVLTGHAIEAAPPLRLPELPEQPHAALILDAPAQALNLGFLTHRPDMLGLHAARLVYGLRALQRWIWRTEPAPGELERSMGHLLGVDPCDIRRASPPTDKRSLGPRPELGLAEPKA